MSSSNTYDAIKSHLLTRLGGSYAIRDWEEIEVALQHGVDPWLALDDDGSDNEVQSIGSPSANWIMSDGFMDVHIMVPSTGSLSVARTIGDQVRDAFQFQYLTSIADETVRIMSVSSPAPGLINDGLWHSMVVTINYQNRRLAATAA